jgi:hypothetical protein
MAAHQSAEMDRSGPSPEDVRAELEAVLRSPFFRRSERLQQFLQYICDLTLSGDGSRINEYLIGSEVFHRGPDYSPNEDSIVRRQAHTLRQKLQEFYANEGSHRPLRIELPVGRYVPIFRRVSTKISERSTETAPVLTSARWHRVGMAGLLVGCLASFFLGRATSGRTTATGAYFAPPGPATTEIWGQWASRRDGVDICFSNPMTTVVKHFPVQVPPSTLPFRIPATAEQDSFFREAFRVPHGGFFYFTPVINQAKMGETIAGIHLTKLLTKLNSPVRATQGRFLNWDDLRRQNLILLGHNEANQWLDPLLKNYPLRLVATAEDRRRAIVNLNPKPGEESNFQIAYAQDEIDGDQEFALVTMIPSIAGDRPLLLINGLNAQATQIATEYLTNETTLADLLYRMKEMKPGHQGPWYFQAVLKTEVHDKVPTTVRLVLVRVL